MTFIAVFVISCALAIGVDGLFEFKSQPLLPSRAELRTLRAISKSKYELAVTMGVNSIDNIQNLENALSSRGINVQNGSISHKQLIETLPNKKAQETNSVARKILKASLYIYNSECIQKNISPQSCALYLADKPIPEVTKGLLDECSAIILSRKDGNNVFRRLLPNNYIDGFYSMNDKLPSPREISNTALHGTVASSNDGNHHQDSHSKNLALVQWSQFIEHDLSKPVASSSQDGQQIECCDIDNYAHSPRNLHPQCAPLIGVNLFSKYGKETCLNYVRSALSIEKCNFGPAQQLNQATGYLDLSQLYGFTRKSQRGMRTFSDGKLKSSNDNLLPLAEGERRSQFCALKSDVNETCFMAGDTRVNSNPYSIISYTIFLRSHNRFADEIKARHPDWTDESIFRAAKKLNVQIYRNIVFEEWLPVALGQKISASINSEPILKRSNPGDYEVSNEFAVAAIRFYFSMMPNVLQRLPTPLNNEIISEEAMSNLSPPALFSLMEQSFRSEALDRTSKVNEFLASMLNQRALRMDATYAGDLIEEFTKARVPSRPNILAFDIQRGRDHGLQGYVKYLEQCEGRSIATWNDLADYIAQPEITKLKSIYEQVADVDLIVGGISEIPANGSTVGPTFTCILGEQFSKIRQWHHNLVADPDVSFESKLKKVTAAKLICANTGLKEVPRNIFFIASNMNPLVPCDELLKSSN